MDEIRLTFTEVAKVLGISEQTVFYWVYSGKIPSHKTTDANGNLIRYVTDQNVVKYLQTQKGAKIGASISRLIALEKAKRDLGN
jgi:excisionase family DNA binding protein